MLLCNITMLYSSSTEINLSDYSPNYFLGWGGGGGGGGVVVVVGGGGEFEILSDT